MKEKLESKADKMFEWLKFTKTIDYTENVRYERKYSDDITVVLEFYRGVYIYSAYNINTKETLSMTTSQELHKAIHEKLKELGWLDD